jgi:hypothetical protein
MATRGHETLAVLAGDAGIRDKVWTRFRWVVEADESDPRDCLVVNSLVERPADEEIADLLALNQELRLGALRDAFDAARARGGDRRGPRSGGAGPLRGRDDQRHAGRRRPRGARVRRHHRADRHLTHRDRPTPRGAGYPSVAWIAAGIAALALAAVVLAAVSVRDRVALTP